MLNAWLSRSGALPLAIELNFWRRYPTNSDRFVLKVVLAYCHRWQNITLWMDNDLLLEFVRLRDPEENIWAFKSAPRLRRVALYDYPGTLILPWGQLTEIFVHFEMTAHDCLCLNHRYIPDLRLSRNIVALIWTRHAALYAYVRCI